MTFIYSLDLRSLILSKQKVQPLLQYVASSVTMTHFTWSQIVNIFCCLLTEVLKEAEVNGSLQEFCDGQSKSAFLYHREPSYFEIPTKEIQTHSKFPEIELNDIPTKDTDTQTPKSTPPVYQSHASFTIEFDECTPGKMKIKDHVTKFSSRQRSKQSSPKLSTTAPTEVQSPESKVADWLVQSDVGMMSSRRPTSDDVYSTKSDLAMHIRTLKGH